MADISKITLPNGSEYNFKDAAARGGQKIYYATCATAAGTAAKVAATTNTDFTLETGAMVRVKFTNADTYNGTSTLNVDSKGAKNIVRVGTTAKARYFWEAGEVVDFVYDGTNFMMLEGGTATTTYYGITALSSATNSTSEVLAATPKAVKAAYDLAASKTDNTGTVTKVSTGTGLTGGDITTTGTISLAGGVVTAGSAGPTAAVTGTEGTTIAVPRITVDEYGRVTELTSYNLTNKNTTYSSKTAASGGTDVSLVTTGEKYTWNNKTSNTGTVTKVSTGVGLTGGDVTTTGTIKAKLKSETASTLDSAAMGSTASRQYAVGVDKSGYLSVNIPWTDADTKNTAGSTDTSSKIFLIGATSQAANPQTYSDNEVYATSGVLTTKAVTASSYVAANSSNSGTIGGVALYGTNPSSYGVAMRITSDSGTHGFITGDWAIYSYMTGSGTSTSSAPLRGWILRDSQNSKNVASVNGQGDAQFDGKMRVGGSDGCTMQFNSTTQALDFIFE